jgi:hypothetical protein
LFVHSPVVPIADCVASVQAPAKTDGAWLGSVLGSGATLAGWLGGSDGAPLGSAEGLGCAVHATSSIALAAADLGARMADPPVPPPPADYPLDGKGRRPLNPVRTAGRR